MDIFEPDLNSVDSNATIVTSDGYEAVYREQRNWLFHYFRRETRDRDDAQSLAHEAMLRFIRVAPATAIAAPRAYLHRIALNLLRDRRKTDRRHAADSHVAYEDYHATGPSLERQLEARDLLRLVDQALIEMKPRTREIFLAVRVDGMRYAEIRTRTGLSFKIIEKEMARALVHINRISAED